jgi:chromosome segregation ATPase
MDLNNLSTIWGPNLLRSKDESYEQAVKSSSEISQIVSTLIDSVDFLVADKYENAFNQLKDKLEAASTQAKESSDMKDLVEKMLKKEKKLKEKNKLRKKELKQCKQDLQLSSEELIVLRGQMDVATKKIKENEGNVDQLNSTITQLNTQITNLSGQVKQAETSSKDSSQLSSTIQVFKYSILSAPGFPVTLFCRIRVVQTISIILQINVLVRVINILLGSTEPIECSYQNYT